MPDPAWPDDLETDPLDDADPDEPEDFGEYQDFEGLEPIDPAELFDRSAAAFLLSAAWPAWMADARCAGMGSDHFISTSRSQWKLAVKVCEECPVREPCLDFALSQPHEEDVGVWGGTTRNERKRIRAERGIPKAGRSAGAVDHVRIEMRESVVALRGRDWPVELIAAELRIDTLMVEGLLAEAERERRLLELPSGRVANWAASERSRRAALVLEEAERYRELSSDGLKQSEIAESFGQSAGAVSGRIRLLDLPGCVRTSFADGHLTIEGALKFHPLVDMPERAEAALARVLEGCDPKRAVQEQLDEHRCSEAHEERTPA